MRNLPNSVHPWWCRRGPDCVNEGGLHLSRLTNTAAQGDEVLQLSAGLWRMDVGPTPPTGLLLELCVGEETDRWPIGLAQSRALAHLAPRLLRRFDH